MGRDIRELLGMFCISFRMVVTNINVCAKIHQALPLRIKHFTACMSYLNKNLPPERSQRE